MKTKRTNDTGESLEGKVAVVTGASQGIGRAVADALQARGCAVVATSRHIAAAGANTGSSVALRCDVRDERSVHKLFAAVTKKFGRLDILVNNAGISHAITTVERLSLHTWREVLETNLTGMFLCTRAALPLMRKGGVIVNNLSVAARGVFPGESAYCASKHGALGFTETLREELRERGIRVLSLLSGPTATDIWDQFMPDAPRNKMMLPETIAQAVANAIVLPETSAVEELRIGPVAGDV